MVCHRSPEQYPDVKARARLDGAPLGNWMELIIENLIGWRACRPR
jgi:hypothetical protein